MEQENKSIGEILILFFIVLTFGFILYSGNLFGNQYEQGLYNGQYYFCKHYDINFIDCKKEPLAPYQFFQDMNRNRELPNIGYWEKGIKDMARGSQK